MHAVERDMWRKNIIVGRYRKYRACAFSNEKNSATTFAEYAQSLLDSSGQKEGRQLSVLTER